MVNKTVKVIKEKKNKNTTDTHLQVKSYGGYEMQDWNGQEIVDALTKECGLKTNDAIKIAEDVYQDIVKIGKTEIEVTTLKNMINYHLLMNGHNGVKLQGQMNVGMSVYDLDNLIKNKSSENSNVGNNNPEAVSLSVVENSMKKYALNKVFSKDISEAHLKGKIQLHDLGQVHKSYCSAHSLRAIAKFGLGKYIHFESISKPARSAQTLIGHLNTFMCSIASYFAGAIGIDYVNIHIAPYVEGMSFKEMKQVAQYMIFSLSQSAFSRGGQTLFADLNLHISIPEWLGKCKAIGPGGVELERTLDSYESTARQFLMAMLEVYEEGDANGMPFMMPKADLHITSREFEEQEAIDVLKRACQVASKNGGVYFVFDKSSTALSACCRLRTELDDNSVLLEPERIRFSGIQNVTINLPQCAYRSGKDEKKFFKEVKDMMDLVIKAHLQKKKYLESIGSEVGTPMYEMVGKPYFDGEPYINLNKGTYIVGFIGINEVVKHLYGKELHEDKEVHKKGKMIIAYMYNLLGKYKKDHRLKFSLEESPAESTSRRLAKCDWEKFEESHDLVKGNKETGDIYYTNSCHYAANAPIDFLERHIGQAEFHNMIESGAITHMFCGEKTPSPESIYKLIETTFKTTNCAQLTISPEFTVCNDCQTTVMGIHKICPKCGGIHTESITRIVGYYSRIKNWNESKKEELEDRHKGLYQIA